MRAPGVLGVGSFAFGVLSGIIAMRIHAFRASLGFFLGRIVAELLTMAFFVAVVFALRALSRHAGG